MKKQLFIMLALMLIISVNSIAQTFTYNGINYNKLSDSTVEVTYSGNYCEYNSTYTGDFIIPDTVRNNDTLFTITRIGMCAFYNSTITSIVFSNSIKTIGRAAFCSCINLDSIIIPNTIEEIDTAAFMNCNQVKKLVISNSIDTIYAATFCNFGSLMDLTLPNNLKYIGEVAFTDCLQLLSVDIPESVTYINDSAFFYCGFQTVSFAPQYISGAAFGDCFNINTIYCKTEIPPTITETSFSGVDNNAVVYVCGSPVTYQNTQWGTTFNNITNAPSILCNSGLADIENDINLNVYPNPTIDYIDITVNNNDKSLAYIYDINGKKIKDFSFRGYYRLDTSDLNNGIYLLKIGNATKKIVK